jgi:putative intracellular protease/amidase
VADGNLITGQNPASSDATAKALLDALGAKAGGARKAETAAR